MGELAYFGPIFMLGVAMRLQEERVRFACNTDAPNLPQVAE